VIAGGFSYEDRSRSGIIAAQDPIMETIKTESEKGKPVLGICNGAQILVESGLVPGIEGYRQGAALTTNRRIENDEVLGTGFYNAWVNIKFDGAPEQCAFTSALEPGELLKIPAAHAEGRFILPEALLEEMKSKKMTLFRYADDDGECDPDFPVNPNGSVHNLAAVCNAAGTIMAIMPHPERTAAGDKIFISKDAIRVYFKPFALQEKSEQGT
jgi:phosphoribosylformylglycinamidine synthase